MANFKIKYEIVQRMLTGPSKRRPCLPMDTCRFLVAHDTGNPGSTAIANVGYYERSRDEDEASAHIFVDDVEIIECIPFLTAEPEKAWHVRYNPPIDNNMYGVDADDAAGGVELCYGLGIDLPEAYKRYVWVLAYSCYRNGLDPAQYITGHHKLDPTRKTDPMNALRLLGKSFEDLVQDVVNEYNDSTAEVVEEYMMNPEDANKVIGFVAAAYGATPDPEAKEEFHRLANELRKASGQPEE